MRVLVFGILLFSVSLAASKSVPSVGIHTSGGRLAWLLKRTGDGGRQIWGAEKLDMLVWMADQVKKNVEGHVKMRLALPELNDFLEYEGMAQKKGDAKLAIEQLLALRRRELSRRDRRGVAEPEDEAFKKKLRQSLSEKDVSDCFAVVPIGKPGDANFDFDDAGESTKWQKLTSTEQVEVADLDKTNQGEVEEKTDVLESASPAAGAEVAEEGRAEEKSPAPEEAAQKATLSIRLVAFEAARKAAVVKEVRAMLGQGLKESKELVESAPKTLKKNVPREEAEVLAEKLVAAGAEVSLD